MTATEKNVTDKKVTDKNAIEKKLKITFHGRVIDHLGIQMYQSPVAAVAELISNTWDADSETADVQLPGEKLTDSSVLTIKDTGIGMTFEECQARFLNVGWCRRGDEPVEKTAGGRTVLGRKGIGKFAGFGIAAVVEIDTISKATGEHTVFKLDLETLRGSDYVQKDGEVAVLLYEGPDEERKKKHGTTITLRKLTMKRRPSVDQFARSMARRFLLHQRAAAFKVTINGNSLPDGLDLEKVQYSFPDAYRKGEAPDGMKTEDGWGIETLSNGRVIRWRFLFYQDPIDEEELAGITVFVHGKLAQKPFYFDLSGGLGGQQAVPYLSGSVEADYIDEIGSDLISPERQRIDWDHEETIPLAEWGQGRIKALLRLWHERRGEGRREELEKKLAGFSGRLETLPTHERRTIRTVLNKLGGIATLSKGRFEELGDAMLTAWESGRLLGLIHEIERSDDLDPPSLLSMLMEAEVLTALNVAEAVKTKLEVVRTLEGLIKKSVLENTVRDHIARHPWLVAPKWELFKKETRVKKIMEDAAKEAKVDTDPAWKGRIDLVLSSGRELLVLEFMRPGTTVDWDHISRFEEYVLAVRTAIDANTALGLNSVTGYLIADRLANKAKVGSKIKNMAKDDLYAMEWATLLAIASAQWKDFLGILIKRAPEDERLKGLSDESAE